MWTNKQIWEFDQINENLKFDLLFAESEIPENSLWKSKLSYPNSDLRDVTVKMFDSLTDGAHLWIVNKDKRKLEDRFVPYVMAVMVDIMVDEEICLNFKIENSCFAVSIDTKTDVIDCKEFFEEFYHLATGFNYDTYTGIPEDETEAELYLTRLQEELMKK